MTSFTLIQFARVDRRTRQNVGSAWISSVSYADGPGLCVKKMRCTLDRDKAARFSLETAHIIAAQFSQYPATLVRPNGEVLVDETAKLQATQCERHTAAMEARNDLNRLFEEAVASATAAMFGR